VERAAVTATAHAAYSLWLMPVEDDADLLEQIVAELAPVFGMPAFPPHVTVQGDLPLRLAAVTSIAVAVAGMARRQRWPVRGVETSEHPFRTFYVALDDADALAPMQECAAAAAGSRHGLSPFPHLSLAYGTLDAGRKAALVASVGARLPKALRFERIVVALSGASVPIPSWRALESFALAAA
jgi:hypothetical protein